MVTDASTDIGRATAIRLAARGSHVFGAVRDDDAAQALRSIGLPRLTPLLVDLGAVENVIRAVERISSHARALDALVHTTQPRGRIPLEVVELADLRRQFELAVVAQLAVTQAMLPLLRAANGRVITVGSMAGRLPVPYRGVHSIAAHSQHALSDVLRQELRGSGVDVVLIEPVIERTDRCSSPWVVADTVVPAFESRRPRASYVCGRHGRALATLAALPPRLRDRLALGVLGLGPMSGMRPVRSRQRAAVPIPAADGA
ncbi:hypothetical protein GCM10009743_36470 [Kribbella swartbergensis]